MASSISSMPAALTALINFVEMSTATAVALQSFIISPLHVVHVRRPCCGMPITVPFLPMVVSRGREDQSSFRYYLVVTLFVMEIHLSWIVVDKTGAFLQAILRAVCSHVAGDIVKENALSR
ncbi:hypothetical protein QR685DRAFT_569369 [Neurospora intermedia]|uniref:Uncharacterized protein n=1 Tax=Neurospora intermedia TaxID=5142 RepID=A0ABR3DKT3_NEUIN